MSDPIPALGPGLLDDPMRVRGLELADAAREFEGLLLGMLLRSATQPLAGESLLDGGSAGRMYRELFFEEIARLAARRDELGFGGMLETQLTPAAGADGEDA